MIPDPADIVQATKPLKQIDILLGLDGAVMSTQEFMKIAVEDVGEDEDFKSGSWVSATDYVNANGGTSCSLNVIGDLTLTMKDLSGTILGTIHHKVIGEGGYENDITVGAALILANVLVFSPKPSMHYLNITMIIVVKVFRKDTIPENGSVDDVEDEMEEIEAAPEAVAFSRLFACADKFDWCLMVTGSVAAAAHGTALVIYLHYFAKIVELLGRDGESEEELFHRFKESLITYRIGSNIDPNVKSISFG
nr:AAA+ ATPase domain-containing protein [Tanacetum cinerariifolium]